MPLYWCNFYTIFIPFLLDIELFQHLDGSETSHYLAYKCYFKGSTDLLSLPLSLFLSFIEQTLTNIFYVSGTFIGVVNTVVIQIKIVPVPTEPRVYIIYGWGLQNRKYSVNTEKENTM